VIRNEKEYRATLRTRDEQTVALKKAKERLEGKGLAPEDVEYALNPLRSFLLEIEDEIRAYEDLKDSASRGRTIKLSKLSSFGRVLVEARIARGYTQRELAERLGVHETQVSRDEKHDYKSVTVDRASRLLETLEFRFDGRLTPAEIETGQYSDVGSEDDAQSSDWSSILHHCQLNLDLSKVFATAFLRSGPRRGADVPLWGETHKISASAIVTEPFADFHWGPIAEASHYSAVWASNLLSQKCLFETKSASSRRRLSAEDVSPQERHPVSDKAKKSAAHNTLTA